jgi:hypothetical protein
LDAHGKPRNHGKVTAGAISLIRQDFSDWSSQSFDDGEASMIIDGESSQESIVPQEDEESMTVET